MINLDSGFNDAPALQGGFSPPTPGGHVFRVVKVSDKASKAGNDMVTLELDIAQGEFKGAFERFPKRYFQLVNGDNLPYFKGMIDAFQKSNPAQAMARVISNLQFDPHALVGLLVGGNLREVEYLNSSNEVAVGLEVAYLVPVADVPTLKPMPLKKLRGGAAAASSGARAARPPEEDDLPF